MPITKPVILAWLKQSQMLFNQHQAYLTDLDRQIGDADHGLNMQRGFNKVLDVLPSVEDQSIGDILKSVGMTLLSQVGGASGPLFGTFFLKMAQNIGEKSSLSLHELYDALNAGTTGIVARGRADVGDKTLCDVLIPLLADFKHALAKNETAAEILTMLAKQSQVYAEATISLLAKKGRASYLKERSVGHQDPGATSVSYLFAALKTAYDEVNND